MKEDYSPILGKKSRETHELGSLAKEGNLENTFRHPDFTSKSIIQIDGEWYQAFQIGDKYIDAVSLKDKSIKRITSDKYKISKIINLSIGNLHANGGLIPEEELENIESLGANTQHLNVFGKFEKIDVT